MQVILHIGAQCTDEDRLLKGLLRNAGEFLQEGIAVPGPSRYRMLLSEAISSLGAAVPAPEAREVLLDAILSEDPDKVERLVLSHEGLFSVPKLALDGGMLYRRAERRLQALARLFEGDELQIFIGLRDFATWLPAMLRATPHQDLHSFLCGADPMRLRWSDLVLRLRSALPGVPITLWCNEDTPLLWGQILREAAGIDPERKITGSFDIFSEIVSPEAMQRFRGFLRENPTVSEAQKRRVMVAFMEKYALPGAMEEELDMPGWDAAYVDMLTGLYDEDVWQMAQLDGVRVLAP
ncbi:hypothetical protein [Salipiger mangrovisoli]|uniref:DUF1835 domain-containing protein n=1 Tax=Salipiger mangrovisoli TaxID=2865933 RepID=A0ABR9X4F5_9RHOB|nr:hypothetical protein [Salipiger mangrovisoli]MBE9638469.1 hypothetical protein [Salipiger mangrovisoli]